MSRRRPRRTISPSLVATALASLATFVCAEARAQLLPQLERASVDSSGAEGAARSESPSLSYDGRFVAFESIAPNLVPDDFNERDDVFVRDRVAGTTERVSVDSFGDEGDQSSSDPDLSPDGRFVAFLSLATDLVPDDANGLADVFVHDRQTQRTERVSVALGGGDPDDNSNDPAVSADGRYVAFQSWASNLVPGDANGGSDVFVYDRSTGITERVSVAFDGGDPDGNSFVPSISDDGRWVAFQSGASNLTDEDVLPAVRVFVFDRTTGSTRLASKRIDGTADEGPSFGPRLSGDGRWITFSSFDVGLVAEPDLDFALDVFLFDLESDERILITATDDRRRQSIPEDISADGRFVVFLSDSRTLLPGNGFKRGDVYVFDRVSGEITRANRTATAAANRCSNEGALSGDGHLVAFKSRAPNLVPDDTNDTEDVFVGLAGFTCRSDADCLTNAFCEANPAGICDAPARTCLFEHKPDGTACDDANPCTTAQSCRAGRCKPDRFVDCSVPPDQCHVAGACDPLNGGACTSTPLPEGTPCELPPNGVACTIGPTCSEAHSCERGFGTEDPDDDRVCSFDDICTDVPDPLQADLDGDGAGDACDPRDGDIRIERALLRWSTPAGAVDGSVKIVGILVMPPGIAPLPAGEAIVARITDGVRTDRSIAFAAGECRSTRAGSLRCRRAGSGRARLSVDFVEGTPSVRFHRLKLRASGLDLPGPFQPPLTVELVSSPAVRGVGVDRIGEVLDCRTGARGMRCVGS
jgi:Tol biopolymer transport system component